MPRHVGIMLLIVAAVCSFGSRLAAQKTAPKVVLVGAGDDPIVTRLRDELRLLGIDVLQRKAIGSELSQAAAADGAAAVALVTHSPARVQVWVAADDSQGVEEATFEVGDDATPEQLALRAVELLRGRLVPVPPGAEPTTAPSASAPSAPKPSADPPLPPPAPPSPPPLATSARVPDAPAVPPAAENRVALGAGLGTALSPGGVSPTMQIGLRGSYRVVWRLHIDAFASIPTLASHFTEPEGEVALRLLDFGGGASLSLTPPDEALLLRGGAGMSAVALFFSGEPVAPQRAASGASWNAAPYLLIQGSYAFVPWLAVSLDAMASVAVREHVIRAAGREVATFGRPLVLGTLGLELRL